MKTERRFLGCIVEASGRQESWVARPARTSDSREEVKPMIGVFLSVLAGVLSAAIWEAVKWALALLKGAKKPASNREKEKRA